MSQTFQISNNIVNTSVNGWFAGPPNLYTIISTIESGNIIGLTQLNPELNYKFHSMVLNGYKITSNGNVYIHLLNTHNMGEEEWRYYCNISRFANLKKLCDAGKTAGDVLGLG